MLPEPHWTVLRRIVTRLEGEPIAWALTGSAGLALQGVPVEIHDLDLQADGAGAYAIERCFAACVARPVAFSASERIGSHLGALAIDGLQVEIMGGLQKRLPSGDWEPPVDVATLRRFVEVEGLPIPVLPLEHEYEAYRRLGRSEKAELIRRTLAERGRDPEPGAR